MILKLPNLALRFLLEICILIIFSYWGFKIGEGNVLKITLSIICPILVVLVWGIFGAPDSILHLDQPFHLFLELIMFVSASIALYTTGHIKLSWIFGLTFIVNRILMHIWKQ